MNSTSGPIERPVPTPEDPTNGRQACTQQSDHAGVHLHLNCVSAYKLMGINSFLLHRIAPGTVSGRDPFSSTDVFREHGVVPYLKHLELPVQKEGHSHDGTSGVLDCQDWSQGKKHFDFLSHFWHG